MAETTPKSKFSSNGFKLILFFSLAILLLSLIGFVLLLATELRQFPLKMLLLGFWGQIFVGACYLYALAEGHLKMIVRVKRYGMGAMIALLIAAGWFGWNYASTHEGKGIVVEDGKVMLPGYVNQQIREQQARELQEMLSRQAIFDRSVYGLKTHSDSLADSLNFMFQQETLFGQPIHYEGIH